MSGIGWIDFSAEHREKVKQVMDLLGAPAVLDELGIGAIRDSFSDMLFPGISTIQTRAKYFLTIPRIFLDYKALSLRERLRRPLTDFLRDQENRVMESLQRSHADEDRTGIIGIRFAGGVGEVQRKPSSIYWTGLRTFGIIETPLSLSEFARKFANPKAAIHDLVDGLEDTQGDDRDAAAGDGPVVRTTAYEAGWVDELALALSLEEATFLARQIETRVPESLIAQILMSDEIRRVFVDLPDEWGFDSFCEKAPFNRTLSERVQRVLWAGKDFWQLLKGAHIRYNVLLQARYGTPGRQAKLVEEWELWREQMTRFPWDRWDTSLLWELARQHHRQIKPFTGFFVTQWIDLARGGTASVEGFDALVTRQERLNKRARARLRPNADERVTEWTGIQALDYRYPQARRIIRDIDAGLGRVA